MRYLFLFAVLISLASCTTYDFDIVCEPTTIDSMELDNGETRKFFCGNARQEYSEVRCVTKTIQQQGEYRYCTTHDGKSVRIRFL